jgi:hypothetical protein
MKVTQVENKRVLAKIQARIDAHKKEIEGYELSDTDILNSKRIRDLGNLIRELEWIKEDVALRHA